MADNKNKLANMLSGEEPIKKGRGYRLSTEQPVAGEPAPEVRQVEPHEQDSRNQETKKPRKEEEMKRRKYNYEVREELIRKMKRIALEEDRKIYEVIEEALSEYLAKRSA
jgi:hypothetical protein